MLPAETISLLATADVILGSDEAGMGAYAGPLVVSAVLAPKGWMPRCSVTDSKDMTDGERRVAAKALIEDDRIFWQTLWAQSPEVDAENVYYANIRLHSKAVEVGLAKAAELFPGKRVLAVVDGNLKIPNALSLPKADKRVLVCSAASVLAKVARDTWMVEKMHPLYPQYGFDKSVGYGTPAHEQALREHGPCEIHRRSFAPIAKYVRAAQPDFLALMEEFCKDDP